MQQQDAGQQGEVQRNERTDRAVVGAVVGAVGGGAISCVAPILAIIPIHGLDAAILMWAFEAAENWCIGGSIAGVLLGLLSALTKPLAKFWVAGLFLACLGATIGVGVGETAGALLLPEDVDSMEYYWNEWPGGCGMIAGMASGFGVWFLIERLASTSHELTGKK